jgi:hypothetical protein
MSKQIHILTADDLVTGLELYSDQTLADAERLLTKMEAQVEPFAFEAIALLESSSDSNRRRVVGHLPISDLREWIQAQPSETRLSSLALTHRPQLQISEPHLSVCRQFLLTQIRHLSVVDLEGHYLGEITRSETFEHLIRSLGVAGEFTTGKTFLLLETDHKQAVLHDIVEAARVEGVRIHGLLELEDEEQAESLTILLKINTSSVHTFTETLRRMGYFTVCDLQQTPVSDDLNQKAEEFLHFLDL